MNWTETTFVLWPCWERGAWRIIQAEEGTYELFRNRGMSTQVWHGFRSLEEAQAFSHAIVLSMSSHLR